jgi:hypothetical protein
MTYKQRNRLKDKLADIAIITIIFLFSLTMVTTLIAQPAPFPQFPNQSLEDVQGVGVVPWGYSKCTVGGPSSPDIQPGIWNVFLQPSDGFSYVGIICRANGTWESFTTQLNAPLAGGTQYAFLIDLASSDKYFGYHDSAATLKIWGGDANCDKQKLLWESTPIGNVNYWRTDTAIFSTYEKAITHLTFEPGYTNQMPYKGNVLIDNLRPYNGTIVGIEDINNTGTYCTKFYDIQGREINNIDRLPIGSIYFNNKKSYIKL